MKRTSEARKRLTGTARPSRVKPIVAVELIAPEPDAGLDRIGKAEWQRVSEAMKKHGLITALDACVLSCYCQNFSRWKSAEAALARDGVVVPVSMRDTHGVVTHEVFRKNPMLAVSESAQRLLSKFADQLGLSPSGRLRLGVETQKPKNENEQENEFAEFD